MTEKGGGSAEQRLYDAVAHWNTDTGYGLADLIDAACQALIDGLDSPTLRELAGASVHDSSWDIGDLVGKSLGEIGIPYPGTVPPGFALAAGGGVARRPGVDSLRLEVSPVPGDAGGEFQVRVYVNGTEMTSAGAGLGMDPYDVLVPTNRLVAASEPCTVAIARCECGVYGCGSTDVTIARDGDLVHWDWSLEVPMMRGVSFVAAEYDAEVARVAADHSWETSERAAGRRVLTDVDRDRLLTYGLRPSWVANDYRDQELFQVALQLDGDYQIFVGTPWRGRSPEELAGEVCATLALPPSAWHATWHAIIPTLTKPPKIAGPSWRPARL
ncbi:hypothetical protein NIE79_000830 [Micromonospora sp. NIE79]|uniref:Uncharacterized protein n=1 Tax=Micromonospora trifolii TaxID=2911208 RepID=A0ABS9MZB2_9ACTN|nr:hypothetical protein [Micromonospora trifolii]MCG5443040.1 hypothetical protein [Micromonospora trifolii]